MSDSWYKARLSKLEEMNIKETKTRKHLVSVVLRDWCKGIFRSY